MRIQETDRILKESRYARNAAHTEQHEGVMSRAVRVLTNLPHRMMEMFKR